MAETPDADQQPEGPPKAKSILTKTLNDPSGFPRDTTPAELRNVVSEASRALYEHYAWETSSISGPAEAIHALLTTALAEQQRRLIQASLKHSRKMADEAAHSANTATRRAMIGIRVAIISAVISGLIGTWALYSSGGWEKKQLEILNRIETRIPTTQPVKGN